MLPASSMACRTPRATSDCSRAWRRSMKDQVGGLVQRPECRIRPWSSLPVDLRLGKVIGQAFPLAVGLRLEQVVAGEMINEDD